MLSGPQRKFVEGIVSGKDQTAAYRAAYPNCSPKAAESKSSRLVRTGKIKEELARLAAKADKKVTDELGITRGRWLNRFLGLADKVEEDTIEPTKAMAARACLREIGLAMHKWYSPAELSVTGTMTVRMGGDENE